MVGDALDNAPMESTVELFKTELVHRHHGPYRDRLEVEQETADWVHGHNQSRLHSSIVYVPPVKCELSYHASRNTADLDCQIAQ